MSEQPSATDLLGLTTEIVSSHVAHNAVPVGDLPNLIQQVFSTLATTASVTAVEERPQPAVSVRKSITPEYIICLEDGKKLKMLKRHLKTSYDMSPADYRERWGLAPDYPMVAPNYAAQRSALAKKIGLGTKPRKRKTKKA